MWLLLDLVSRGYRYYTSGYINDDRKVPGFVEKMHERFSVLLTSSGRTKRHRKGLPTARLVMHRDWDGIWCWWLLFAGDKDKVVNLANLYRESLNDAMQKDARLKYRNDYVLRKQQRPASRGGGNAWTWFLTKPIERQIEKQLLYLASAHGRKHERVDNLIAAVEYLRNKPMFHGVRLQSKKLIYLTKRMWNKTHTKSVAHPSILDEQLPWFSERIRIYE